uniref:DOD-type homing endonuclease domain-containing protein n=1 Tax=viral metagenome TaxID=1070528 RepID=A0A6C0ICD8_9ZZZZ
MNKRFAIKKCAPKAIVPKLVPYVPSEEYKRTVCANSYIGKKGYTVPKSILDPLDLEILYKELYMIPVKMGPAFGSPGVEDESAFPVYRENTNKIYLPRFYGIERYGFPVLGKEIDLSKVASIDCTFDKPLRDYQEEIVDTFVSHIHKNPQHHSSGGIIQVPCGRGKCVSKDTLIIMFDGTTKKVQDIVVGDQIMGDDSTPRNILTLARGRETMYKVCTKRGEGYTVNESHILSLKYATNNGKKIIKNDVLDISVLDYLALPKSYHGRGGNLYGYRVPIVFPEKPQEIDPYLVGYWLGDGHSYSTKITTQDSGVIKYLVDCFKTKHKELYLRYTGSQYDYRINSIGGDVSKNIFMDFLRKNNLINNKHIPLHYKCNSRKNQLALLAGIIDSDGYYHQNCYEIIQKNEKLLDDIVFLARSLGFSAYKKQVQKTCTNARDDDGNICPKTGTYYLINICGKGLEELPTVCPRKKGQVRKQIKDVLKYRIHLEKLPEDDYYGFEIDGNHRFVLGDFTVTHNTVMSIKILSLIAKKTLIIVHKEFLLNQWVERIRDFLPTAKIGRIQGPVFDSQGKDIVIGMLQTLYDRDFPENAFDDFGLTIIDETHRIGSCQFSKALLRIQTPYMLGVTATLDRKDGLTKVLHMFIGPLVYSKVGEKSEDSNLVLVRGMTFVSNDPEFNNVVVDFRGNPQFSTMISKLCNHGPRTRFIVNMLADLVIENPDAQILILGHNRSLLSDVFDAIVGKGFAEPGMYVGGMKQHLLDISSQKQIVVATFSMAAEALDIPNLSILVMITPKSDIIQSVGRIFRSKHDRKIIVDIVDKHDLFQNQWNKRRIYYKKSGYRIQMTDSIKYKDFEDESAWTTVFDPSVKSVKESSSTKKSGEASNKIDAESCPFGGKCMIQFDQTELEQETEF